jgi:hypothetical protein
MAHFNKYDYLSDLQDTIKHEQPEDIWEFVHHEIDNACIYYADCFAIITELNYTHWDDCEFGEITNIAQLAFVALYEFVSDNLKVEA